MPYARCPSGAEGTIIEDADLPRVIWGLDLEDNHHSAQKMTRLTNPTFCKLDETHFELEMDAFADRPPGFYTSVTNANKSYPLEIEQSHGHFQSNKYNQKPVVLSHAKNISRLSFEDTCRHYLHDGLPARLPIVGSDLVPHGFVSRSTSSYHSPRSRKPGNKVTPHGHHHPILLTPPNSSSPTWVPTLPNCALVAPTDHRFFFDSESDLQHPVNFDEHYLGREKSQWVGLGITGSPSLSEHSRILTPLTLNSETCLQHPVTSSLVQPSIVDALLKEQVAGISEIPLNISKSQGAGQLTRQDRSRTSSSFSHMTPLLSTVAEEDYNSNSEARVLHGKYTSSDVRKHIQEQIQSPRCQNFTLLTDRDRRIEVQGAARHPRSLNDLRIQCKKDWKKETSGKFAGSIQADTFEKATHKRWHNQKGGDLNLGIYD